MVTGWENSNLFSQNGWRQSVFLYVVDVRAPAEFLLEKKFKS